MLWIDADHPANKGVLRSLGRRKKTAQPIQPPDSVADPYMRCGSHPDIVERVWGPLMRGLPAACRCILYGTPALVHPLSGVVLAVAYGTEYCLRLPDGAVAEALQAGACTSTTWTDGGSTNIRHRFGPDWVFGTFLPQEAAWCRAVYQHFHPCKPPRPMKAEPEWLTWNDAAVPKLARSIKKDGGFEQLPILADALEEAGCTDAEVLAHCRNAGRHDQSCWVLQLLLPAARRRRARKN
jgi:hypothetical protein